MTNPTEGYPLATADGKSIPNEVLRPRGVYLIALTSSPSAIHTLASDARALVLTSDVDCLLRFNASSAVSIPANATLLSDAMYLPKQTVFMISPEVLSISGVSLSGTGTLFVTVAKAWAGLALQYQYSRR